METINDRMEMLVNQQFDGNKAAFAKTIGLSPTGLSNYLGTKRRSKPSVDMVAKIITKLDVDARWLITGDKPEPEKAEALPTSKVETHGPLSPASLNGDVSLDVGGAEAVLAEKVEHYRELLAEKEQLIKGYRELLAEKERLMKVLMKEGV